MLVGREPERQQIARLVAGARLGQSGVLVLRGEPGIGKTAVIEDTAGRAGDILAMRDVQIRSEFAQFVRDGDIAAGSIIGVNLITVPGCRCWARGAPGSAGWKAVPAGSVEPVGSWSVPAVVARSRRHPWDQTAAGL